MDRRFFNWDEDDANGYDDDSYFVSEPIPAPEVLHQNLPETLQQLRQLERDPQYNLFSRKTDLFAAQARIAEHYEDTFVSSCRLLPTRSTYRDLNDKELRGYFGWRTRYRQGTPDNSYSPNYPYIYISEILNGIGISNEEEGLSALRTLDKTYGQNDKLHAHLARWIPQYLVCHHFPLDRWTPEDIESVDPCSRIWAMLTERNSGSQADYGEFLNKLVSKYITDPIPGKDPRWFYFFICQGIKKIDAYYEKRRKKTTFWKDYFYSDVCDFCSLFEGTAFRSQISSPYTFEMGPFCKIEIRYSSAYIFRKKPDAAKLERFSGLLHKMNVFYRAKVEGNTESDTSFSPQWMKKELEKAFETTASARELDRKRHIQLDMSQLSEIRSSAAVTRDKLLTDEERGLTPDVFSYPEDQPDNSFSASAEDMADSGEEDTKAEETAQAKDVPASAPAASSQPVIPESDVSEQPAEPDELPFHLSPDEYHFLHCVLYGEDWHWISSRGLMLSILIDSINEKAFDEFGDTILTEDDGPELIPDYIDDLKGRISK